MPRSRMKRILLLITMPIWIFPGFILLGLWATWCMLNEILDDWEW